MGSFHSGMAWGRLVSALLYGVESGINNRSHDLLGSISSGRTSSRRCRLKRELARCPNIRESKGRSLEGSQETILGITKL